MTMMMMSEIRRTQSPTQSSPSSSGQPDDVSILLTSMQSHLATLALVCEMDSNQQHGCGTKKCDPNSVDDHTAITSNEVSTIPSDVSSLSSLSSDATEQEGLLQLEDEDEEEEKEEEGSSSSSSSVAEIMAAPHATAEGGGGGGKGAATMAHHRQQIHQKRMFLVEDLRSDLFSVRSAVKKRRMELVDLQSRLSSSEKDQPAPCGEDGSSSFSSLPRRIALLREVVDTYQREAKRLEETVVKAEGEIMVSGRGTAQKQVVPGDHEGYEQQERAPDSMPPPKRRRLSEDDGEVPADIVVRLSPEE